MQYGTTKVRDLVERPVLKTNREKLEFIQKNYPEVYLDLKEEHLLICLNPDCLVETQTKSVNKVLANYFEKPLLTKLELVPEL